MELEDGTQFNVGTGFSDQERESPPEIGTVITFRYQEFSNAGVPRFPSFMRVRPVEQGGKTKKKSSKKVAKKKASTTSKKSTRKKAASQSASTTAAGARYFELQDDKSSKFWEIAVDGTEVTVRYGRIGANGTTKVKEFDDEAKAKQHADKLIEQQTGKGYEETDSD